MKRYLFAIFVIFSCLFFAPPKIISHAETQSLEFNTLYPANIIDYKDLSNISKIAVNNDYIAYTQDNTTLYIYNKETKTTNTITNLTNIVKVKLTENTLVIITDDSVYYSNNISLASRETLNKINSIVFDNLKTADIYITDTEIYLSFIDNNIFKLYEFNLNFTTSKSNPTKTIQSVNFNDAYLMTINDKSAYIISNPLSPTMYIQNYQSNEPISTTLKVNYQSIDTFYQNGNEYILTFTGENLRLLTPSCEELSTITINEFDEIFLKITDIDYYNNLIYVSDSNHNSIQTYSISQDEQLQSEKILICASSKEIGRFNNVNNIISSGDKLIVSDTANNRIQIITKTSDNSDTNTVSVISTSQDISPRAINLDSLGNMYFISNTATHSQIYKYSTNGSTYTLSSMYEKIGLNNIGYISDMTITNDDTVYMLDYINNKLLYISDKGIEEKSTLGFGLSENAQIKYIKELNLLTILNNNVLHILSNSTNTSLLHSISMTGSSITCDLNSIYVLDNNQIKLVNILQDEENFTLSNSNKNISDINISNYNSIHFDISTRIMYSYNSNRQCIEYFTPNLVDSAIQLEDITTQVPLSPSSTLIPTTLDANTIIYDLPYHLGKSYNYDGNITTAFIIDNTTYADYYRILFNNNNTLTAGYISSNNAPEANHKAFIERKINVVTINQEVPIYKYPTLLKSNNTAPKITSLEINTHITLCAESPITIDGKKFFKYEDNNIVGFVFNADVVLSENTHIEYLKNANATVKTYDKAPTIIYAEDKTTIVREIDNQTRVYIEDYDKNSEYTKIVYKTTDLQTIEGYVLTKYIEPDKLDNSKIVIICIIILSFILLAIVIISYFIINKKKN